MKSHFATVGSIRFLLWLGNQDLSCRNVKEINQIWGILWSQCPPSASPLTLASGHAFLLPLNTAFSSLLQCRNWGRHCFEQTQFFSKLAVSVSYKEFPPLLNLLEVPWMWSRMKQCFCCLFRQCGFIWNTRPKPRSTQVIKLTKVGSSHPLLRKTFISCPMSDMPAASGTFW